MITIQRYFLSILMFNSLCLSAMEHVDCLERIDEKDHVNVDELTLDTEVRNIGDKIDRDLLGIGACECGHLKSLFGSCVSFVMSYRLNDQKATDEMKTIMSYILENVNKEQALQRLIKDHLYVYYLMKHLVDQKVNEINNVTGFTVDRLYDDCVNTDESDVVKKMVRDDVFKRFFDDMDIVPENLLDIHCTILTVSDCDIKQHSLLMSSNGKYVKVTDTNNIRHIWDMETGKLATLENEKNFMWVTSHKKLSEQDKKNACPYRAMIIANNYFPTHEHYYSGVLLFKAPEKASYLCQRAFENSRTWQEFDALGQSKPAEQITGFVKENLKKAINNKIRLFADHVALGRSTQ